ncbi:hypothetical protein F2Q70_00003964 [Brassica cretica]|uniref:Uncharacterized protein n=1 Tax=Brassica cretica TaxID=69181 RepID=A0A8S9IP27_BRACR|nr:hypothetical protein F2Q70_00003964 [Brassica cretica]
MRGYGHSVNRLDRSLVWSIKRLRAVTPSTLSEVFVWPVSGQRVCASLGSLLVAWVRPTSMSDYRTDATGLLGFYRFYRLSGF